jgi:hypothetical protein
MLVESQLVMLEQVGGAGWAWGRPGVGWWGVPRGGGVVGVRASPPFPAPH